VAAIARDVGAAEAAGRLEAPAVHLARTVLELDDAGWEELSRRLRELGDAALRLQEASHARTPAERLRASRLALLHFPAA
jgi:hypothetical protein